MRAHTHKHKHTQTHRLYTWVKREQEYELGREVAFAIEGNLQTQDKLLKNCPGKETSSRSNYFGAKMKT